MASTGNSVILLKLLNGDDGGDDDDVHRLGLRSLHWRSHSRSWKTKPGFGQHTLLACFIKG